MEIKKPSAAWIASGNFSSQSHLIFGGDGWWAAPPGKQLQFVDIDIKIRKSG